MHKLCKVTQLHVSPPCHGCGCSKQVNLVHTELGSTTTRGCLPITPHHLHQICEVWNAIAADINTAMLWVAVTNCFLLFFLLRRDYSFVSGTFDPAAHLGRGDVAVDNV